MCRQTIFLAMFIFFLAFTNAVAAESEDYIDEEEYTDPNLAEILAEPEDLMETAPVRLTLEDCIRMGLEHNAKLQATGYNIDAAKAQASEADAAFWPVVDYEYRSAPVPKDVSDAMRSYFSGDISWWNKLKIGVGVPVTTFGKLSLAKEMAKGGVKAAEVQAFQEKSQLVSKMKQLYFGVLLAEEMGKLLKKAHEHLQEEIDKREKDEEGEITYDPIENLKLKVFIFDLEKKLAETRQKEQIALEGLRVQMGLTAGTVFTVYSRKLRPVDANLKSFDDYMAVAVASRPDAKLLETGLNVKRSQYLLEKRKLMPDLGVGAFFELGRTATKLSGVTATDDYNDPFNFTRAGFGMQLSGRFDFHGSKSRIDKARSEYYKLNLEQMIAKEAIKLDVKDAYLKAKTSEANLRRAQEAQKTARQLLFLTQSNYEIGIGEQKGYVEALQLVLMTRGRYFEAVFDYNSTLAQLDEKVGILPEVAR